MNAAPTTLKLLNLAWLLALASVCAAAEAPEKLAAKDAEDLFVRRIQPLFTEKCLACHGEDQKKLKAKFDMRTRSGLLKGGDSGSPALIPGDPENSPIYIAVTRKNDDLAMPPKENDKLTTREMEWVKSWIAAGAPWPDAERQKELAKNTDKWSAADGIEVVTSGGLADDWTHRKYKPENLWAYQPLRKPAVPATSGNPIDAFINANLTQAGLQPAAPADRPTLLRRATYDLTGLPPSPAEMEAFVKDPRPDEPAFAAVVDRLLASPHYGEQWGRHWLDVVRYADSSGFANDFVRGNTWRYHDYVIRAFNSDKPYDQFVREQLAGDEIAEAHRKTASVPDEGGNATDPTSARDSELMVAAGFLRMGAWELTGMEVARVARQRFLDDVTDIVGQAFLGHMLQCCRCHDHKFDPLPTRDYYSFQAAFATTQMAERDAPFLKEENQTGFEERKYLEARRQQHLATLKRLDEKMLISAESWFKEPGRDATKWNKAVEQARNQERGGGKKEFVGAFGGARNRLLQQGLPEDQVPPKLLGFTPEDFGNERIARKGLERLKWEVDRYQPLAFTVYDGRTPEVKAMFTPTRMPADRMENGELEQVAILAGGDPFAPTIKVTPGTLSVVDKYTASYVEDFPQFKLPEGIEGRRKALADWIVNPKHPLTARVMANRIWQGHFGTAIAGNPNNFGATGKKPTHPELLDWLASTFIEKGWSVKEMHRLIMSSQAYRRGADYPDRKQLAEKDPTGTSYAVFKPRRLTAEELRDSMLQISGELNAVIGGIPARTEINLEAALQPRQVMGTFAEAWQPSPKPEQRHRRSVYALKIRGQRDPFMEVFNEPSPELSCEARDASTVTPQVFSLFNGQPTYDRALAFANRLLKESSAKPQVINRAFQLAYGRTPSASESQAALQHWEAMTARHQTLSLEKKQVPTEVTREAVEENTGEKFKFTEKLAAYADFVPDLQASEVSMETRGLAEVCLVLFNSNEFAYVY